MREKRIIPDNDVPSKDSLSDPSKPLTTGEKISTVQVTTTTKNNEVLRKMSFTSAAMVMGPFPERAAVVDPILNAFILFRSIAECPSESDVLPLVERLLAYERFSGIPVGMARKGNWTVKPCENLDPKRLIRVFECDCSD